MLIPSSLLFLQNESILAFIIHIKCRELMQISSILRFCVDFFQRKQKPDPMLLDGTFIIELFAQQTGRLVEKLGIHNKDNPLDYYNAIWVFFAVLKFQSLPSTLMLMRKKRGWD